ncbi:MAG: 1-acyl-sn-glycerol-3-phosphate acyltransferase [Kiritimatiellae bacterium]|nr:1-acyl-sn-glycerol-3-phosphate acyltransferase [Kiritimatiellia bacterium]MDW8458411.1 lysophospholipid acyltransferase family protein [Verrucomicrobiota bacterium]
MTGPEYSPRLYRICRFLLTAFFKLYNRFEVAGASNIPCEGGVLLAANHASFLDPPALGCAAAGRFVRYLARDTLFSNPKVGSFLLRLAAVPISRDKGDVAALKKAISLLKSGECVGLFPEGTRSPDGRLQPAKPGVGFLVAKAGVPVVPAYIDGTFRALSRHHKWIRPAKIRVVFGSPIQPAEWESMPEAKDRYERIGALVMSRIAELAPKDSR